MKSPTELRKLWDTLLPRILDWKNREDSMAALKEYLEVVDKQSEEVIDRTCDLEQNVWREAPIGAAFRVHVGDGYAHYMITDFNDDGPIAMVRVEKIPGCVDDWTAPGFGQASWHEAGNVIGLAMREVRMPRFWKKSA